MRTWRTRDVTVIGEGFPPRALTCPACGRTLPIGSTAARDECDPHGRVFCNQTCAYDWIDGARPGAPIAPKQQPPAAPAAEADPDAVW